MADQPPTLAAVSNLLCGDLCRAPESRSTSRQKRGHWGVHRPHRAPNPHKTTPLDRNARRGSRERWCGIRQRGARQPVKVIVARNHKKPTECVGDNLTDCIIANAERSRSWITNAQRDFRYACSRIASEHHVRLARRASRQASARRTSACRVAATPVHSLQSMEGRCDRC